MATGITGDRFWITASYADMANGAIWGAVRACQTRLPGWLCTSAGNLLSSWAQGWGSASNHGLWAEIYWAPPHVNAGRWKPVDRRPGRAIVARPGRSSCPCILAAGLQSR
ncbi:hypothetical protein [Amycolatopsis sp. NPDC051061]|uniref:hypothetical protein n=1 Tax=Amycolatopsis sp. NPDC051061 TaxID=3155042 RepID=UPI00343E2B9D